MFHRKTQQSPYTAFAGVYDQTMEEIPYHHWAYFIYQTLESRKIKHHSLVVDIGAGTGMVASKLAAHYRLLALDISENMLHSAMQRGLSCIKADMRHLPLRPGSVAAAYSTHDCINYLTDNNQLGKHLEEVNIALKRNGLYIFDFSTEYNVIKYFDKRTFIERHNNTFMKWHNIYDQARQEVISTIDITEYPAHIFGLLFFWKRKTSREIHVQKIFDEKLVEQLSKKAGFKVINKTYDYNDVTTADRAHLVVLVLKKL